MNGGLLTYSDLANSLNVSMPSIKTYLDYLENAFLIRRLGALFYQYWQAIGKIIQNIYSWFGLTPFFIGHSEFWSNFRASIIGQFLGRFCSSTDYSQFSHWSWALFLSKIKDGAELDLLLVKYGVIEAAIEIKFGSSPAISRGNTQAWADLQAKQNLIITPETEDYWYKNDVRVCNLKSMWGYLRKSGLLDGNQ